MKGGRWRAQDLKCLLYKHDVLSLHLQSSHKNLGTAAHIYKPSTEGQRQINPKGTVVKPKWGVPGLVRNSVSNTKGKSGEGHQILTFDLHRCMYMYLYTHITTRESMGTQGLEVRRKSKRRQDVSRAQERGQPRLPGPLCSVSCSA